MYKLMHVISDTNIGGAGKYLLTYLENCNKKIFDIIVVLPHGSKLENEVKKLGFDVALTEGLADKSVSFPAMFNLYEIFKTHKPDIVHTHAAFSARVAARIAGVKKIVYTRHSVFPQKAYLTKGIGKKINGFTAKLFSDKIIAVANAAKKNLTETGIDDKMISVIYNGVNAITELPDEKKSKVRESLGIKTNEFVIAIIARLELVKGHEYFINAAQEVKEAGIKARFVIAGTGTREQALKQLVKDNKLEDTVLFTGFLKDIYQLENIMDIQVNASFGTEAASLSLLEGMSIGKCAVVSDFGGNPEVIENGVNGFVVPQKNSHAIAQKIIYLLSDENLKKEISANAVKVFNKRFTSKIMTQNMESFYEQVVERNDEK
ncbi:MAG: glycosyltransferase [Clostridiaceae bacterium]|nr:glycosyltransferase [Clostridiaceae bacterium]